MNGGSNPPTLGDYAWSETQSLQVELTRLRKQVQVLEDRVAILERLDRKTETPSRLDRITG